MATSTENSVAGDSLVETATNSRSIEYVKELMKEKLSLDASTHSIAMRLLDEEIIKAQRGKPKEPKPIMDLYRESHIRTSAKVMIPVKDFPKINFVGRLLGPKGSTLKRIQEETMTRMAILGRGSMRDKQKEEEFRASLDPKYGHLSEELHLEIFVQAPPAEAYARLAYALAEVRKYLTPEAYQMEDEAATPFRRSAIINSMPVAAARPARFQPPSAVATAPTLYPSPQVLHRPAAPQPQANKVMSILDKARIAMEETAAGHVGGGATVITASHQPLLTTPAAYDDTAAHFGGAYAFDNGSTHYNSYDTGYNAPVPVAPQQPLQPVQQARWQSYAKTGLTGPPGSDVINCGGGGGGGGIGRFNPRPSPYSRAPIRK